MDNTVTVLLPASASNKNDTKIARYTGMNEIYRILFNIKTTGNKRVLSTKDGSGVTFTVTTWLFSTIQERLSSGPAAKASAFFSAVSLYMAAQCFMGLIL